MGNSPYIPPSPLHSTHFTSHPKEVKVTSFLGRFWTLTVGWCSWCYVHSNARCWRSFWRTPPPGSNRRRHCPSVVFPRNDMTDQWALRFRSLPRLLCRDGRVHTVSTCSSGALCWLESVGVLERSARSVVSPALVWNTVFKTREKWGMLKAQLH